MPTIRLATINDAQTITQHRHRMFDDSNFASEERLCEVDAAFEPWVKARLADGRYIGWLTEEDGLVVAGAGLWVLGFPPHWIDPQPIRGYLLNVYTAPAYRGRGYARHLLALAIEECKKLGIVALTLHASKFGKPMYERAGFTLTGEMMLRLE